MHSGGLPIGIAPAAPAVYNDAKAGRGGGPKEEEEPMKPLKVAILGAGNIAGKMARTLGMMDTAEPYAVAARDLDRARAFAGQYGISKAYGCYEEMAADPEVELVYVATPHSHHYAHARLCLEAGKPVLVEKAFTATAPQARELVELGRARGLLVAEAIWPRYMPLAKTIRQVAEGGIIGDVTCVTGSMGSPLTHVRRMWDPALAGGALLDVGVYAVNYALIALGSGYTGVTSSAVLLESGVDAQNSITLTYPGGRMAVLASTMTGLSNRGGTIQGDKGYAVVDNINNFEAVRVYDQKRNPLACYTRPVQLTGFEYQVDACARAIRAGEVECPEMPHSEILRVMELFDSLRRQWGVRYPWDA